MVQQIRLWSGLIIAAFVVAHLSNHMFGVISFEAANSIKSALIKSWGHPVGQVLLYGSLLIHFCFGLFGVYQLRTLRMPVWKAAQIILGLAIFPLIWGHVVGTRGVQFMTEAHVHYEFVVWSIWVYDPTLGIQQAVALVIIWLHLAVGVHFWLRVKPWYGRAWPGVYLVMVLIPVLSLLGYFRMGLTMLDLMQDAELKRAVFAEFPRITKQILAVLGSVKLYGYISFLALIALAVAARQVRRFIRGRFGVYQLHLGVDRSVAGSVGQTVLQTIWAAGIPHAAVCGGRGRCTTCRIEIVETATTLALPGTQERAALERIEAAPNVRLACQLAPRHDLTVRPLLPPSASAGDGMRASVMDGREQAVACMFVDLRKSTALAENRLPYDVLFILNQLFAELSQALHDTDGHYAQFNGDGLMALYGLKSGLQQGCRDAINGAAAILARVDELSETLRAQLDEPLKVGVGIHAGEAIVGLMGPPDARNFSSIGDVINVAARLESLTKEYGSPLVISKNAAVASGYSFDGQASASDQVKGRADTIEFYTVKNPALLLQQPDKTA